MDFSAKVIETRDSVLSRQEYQVATKDLNSRVEAYNREQNLQKTQTQEIKEQEEMEK